MSSQQSKDNTCPVCGSKNYEPALGLCTNGCHLRFGSGQQEDNTGHQTAETPDAQPLDNVSGELIEILADIEHERWSNWMKWVFQNGKWNTDASFTIKTKKAQRWFVLAGFKYEDLDEETKEYDRVEVRKTLEAIKAHEALPSHNASESMRVDAPLTDSKPEKPQGWDMEAAKESHLHTAHKRCFKCDKRDEPSKPDQLICETLVYGFKKGNLYQGHQSVYWDKFDKEFKAEQIAKLKALLATEYDRGKVDALGWVKNFIMLGTQSSEILEQINRLLIERTPGKRVEDEAS
jgi:hypothetical protein